MLRTRVRGPSRALRPRRSHCQRHLTNASLTKDQRSGPDTDRVHWRVRSRQRADVDPEDEYIRRRYDWLKRPHRQRLRSADSSRRAQADHDAGDVIRRQNDQREQKERRGQQRERQVKWRRNNERKQEEQRKLAGGGACNERTQFDRLCSGLFIYLLCIFSAHSAENEYRH